jgi:hypothetical protein
MPIRPVHHRRYGEADIAWGESGSHAGEVALNGKICKISLLNKHNFRYTQVMCNEKLFC